MKLNESSPIGQSQHSLSRTGVVALFFVGFAYFAFLALNRFIAADEGFYLLAAREVMSGRDLYLDFFYPQMPLFPYFYGAILKGIGFTWDGARIVAALVSATCAWLMYYRLKSLNVRFITFWGLALFLGSGLVIAWFPTAKTYSLATLFLLVAYLLATRTFSLSIVLSLFISGIFVGLAVNTRLFYCVVIPFFLFEIWMSSKGSRLRSLLFFLLGGALTYLPHLYYLALDPDAYWFNNVGYHLVRSHRTAELDELSRHTIYQILFGFQADERMDGFQFPLLFYLTCLSSVYAFVRCRFISLAFPLSISLLVMSLSPNPIHLQYFSAIIPFFILATCESFARVPLPERSFMRTVILLVLLIFSIEYLRHSPYAFYRNTASGDGVKGVEEGQEELSRLSLLTYVTYAIDKHTAPGELVWAQWPGYLVGTHASIYPGMENQFWIRISHKLTAQERRHYHLFTRKEIWQEIARPELKTIVIDERKVERYFPRERLQKAGFKVVENVKGVLLWKKLTAEKE